MRYVVSYLALYAATLTLLVKFEHFQIAEPLFVLGIFGVALPLIAWFLTRNADPIAVTDPHRGALAYLLAVVVFATWGLGAIGASQPTHDIIVLLAKLTVMVAIPWVLFDRSRLPLRFNSRDALTTMVMSALLLLFQFFVGRGGREIAAAHFPWPRLTISLVLVFLWLVLEVGLVEEYFFRRIVQTRLESLLRSSVGGIILASLVFGLIHVPGLYLRTAHTGEALGNSPSLLLATGYAVVILSPTGLFLGTLWSRTRNLAIVIIVHAAGDLLPNVIDLTRHFTPGH